MSDPHALLRIVAEAFNTVACTTNLAWGVRKRVLKLMERRVRTYAYADAEDFAGWAEYELAELLANEDIGPLCRLTLAAWFAGEVMNWLRGDFDQSSDAAD